MHYRNTDSSPPIHDTLTAVFNCARIIIIIMYLSDDKGRVITGLLLTRKKKQLTAAYAIMSNQR